MLLIDNGAHHDPRVNLALEEWAVRNLDPEPRYLLFYVNEPSIIIGRNQCTLEQINRPHVEQHGIHVVRRISGGGTVYHDHGNLNFSFICPYEAGTKIGFQEFTEPVIRALRELGVEAELTGRNDIVVGDRKISGNAQFTTVRSMFSHGTLLFDSDLDEVVRALNVSIDKIESKGLESVRSRVANISELLDSSMSFDEFRAHLVEVIYRQLEEVPRYRLDERQWRQVHELAERKYRQWHWNYGGSPRFNLQKKKRFPAGEIDVRIDVHKGRIRDIRFFGDFLGTSEVAELEDRLRGVLYEPDRLRAALDDVDVGDYFGELSLEELLAHLY